MSGAKFQFDLRVLELRDYDLILGPDWMRRHSLITFDYAKNRLIIHQGAKLVELQGILEEVTLKLMSLKSLNKLISKGWKGVKSSLLVMSSDNAHIEPETEVFVSRIPAFLQPLIAKYQNIFQTPKTLPPKRTHDHQIPLKAATDPINVRPYKYSTYQKTEIEKLVAEMLKNGVIRESHSRCASPVLLVKKKEGTWRFSVDYRELNKAIVKDKFPIPIIQELINELKGASVFTKLDLRSGYHQISMALPDISKTAFRTHQGHYEFLVMPFGLTNAPATFQSLMNSVFKPYLRQFVLVFFDDILVYSSDPQTHLHHLELVFKLLDEHQLFIKASKSEFATNSVTYLGYIISKEGVATDPSKIQAMLDWPQPRSLEGLRGFLGLTGYYRRFIQGYGMISKPLTELLKKDQFHWKPQAT